MLHWPKGHNSPSVLLINKIETRSILRTQTPPQKSVDLMCCVKRERVVFAQLCGTSAVSIGASIFQIPHFLIKSKTLKMLNFQGGNCKCPCPIVACPKLYTDWVSRTTRSPLSHLDQTHTRLPHCGVTINETIRATLSSYIKHVIGTVHSHSFTPDSRLCSCMYLCIQLCASPRNFTRRTQFAISTRSYSYTISPVMCRQRTV